jgi:hypothetical protein
MKTIVKYLEELGHTMEQFKEMSPEDRMKIYNDLNESNSKAFEALQNDVNTSKKSLEQAQKDHAKTQAEEIKTVFEAMKEISKTQKEQGIALAKQITEANGGSNGGSLAKEIAENKETLKGIAKGENGTVELKATTVRANITNNEQAQDLTTIGQLATGRMRAIDLFPTITMGNNDNGTVRYYDWDEATTVRAAAMLAEGDTFPESEAKWEKFSIDLKKIGDSLPVTEEFFEDEAMFAAELEMFLRLNVDLVANDQVINGDGTGNNLTGLVTSSPGYVPVASGISDASIYDLIVKVKEDIETDQDAKYMANFALMNIADVNLMKLKKDANENYIMPPFVDRSGNVVDGITIVVDNKVAANTMIMGDSRFGRKYEKNGVQLSRGVVNAQFVEDTETLKVRKRMLLLVRNVDQTGFRKVTSISAALTTLAS